MSKNALPKRQLPNGRVAFVITPQVEESQPGRMANPETIWRKLDRMGMRVILLLLIVGSMMSCSDPSGNRNSDRPETLLVMQEDGFVVIAKNPMGMKLVPGDSVTVNSCSDLRIGNTVKGYYKGEVPKPYDFNYGDDTIYCSYFHGVVLPGRAK